jgi:hypothetical protein
VSTNDDLANFAELKGKKTPAPGTTPKEIKKKSNTLPLILSCVVLIIGTIFAVGIVFSGPDPEVVAFSGGDLNASLFDFKCQVHATIKNNGKAGNIIVNFKVTQDNHTFDRRQKLFLKADQQKDIMEEFAEVDMTGTVPEYVVTAKAE